MLMHMYIAILTGPQCQRAYDNLLGFAPFVCRRPAPGRRDAIRAVASLRLWQSAVFPRFRVRSAVPQPFCTKPSRCEDAKGIWICREGKTSGAI